MKDYNLREVEKLLYKAVTEQLEPEEQQRLNEVIADSEAIAEVYARIKRQGYSKQQVELLRKLEVERSWNKLQDTIKPARKLKRRALTLIVSAAASVALLLALGNYFGYLIPQSDVKPVFVEGNLPEIEPKVRFKSNAKTVEITDTVDLVRLEKELRNAGEEQTTEPELVKVEVGAGQIFCFRLPDGSSVCLNAGSSLEYPVAFTRENRTVALVGEAFFDVVHNEQKPFVVNFNQNSVKVLGTRFDIKCYDDAENDQVTLVQGLVGVETPDEACVLQPGEQAVVSIEDNSLSKREVEVDDYIWWMGEKFHFHNTSIQEIASILSHWYGLPIIATVNSDKTFSGEFPKLKNVNDAVEIIRLSSGMKVVIERDKIIIK